MPHVNYISPNIKKIEHGSLMQSTPLAPKYSEHYKCDKVVAKTFSHFMLENRASVCVVHHLAPGCSAPAVSFGVFFELNMVTLETKHNGKHTVNESKLNVPRCRLRRMG